MICILYVISKGFIELKIYFFNIPFLKAFSGYKDILLRLPKRSKEGR